MYDSHTRQIKNDYNQFIMFGCWNQKTCTEDGDNSLSKTMKNLRVYCKKKNPILLLLLVIIIIR